MSTSPWTDTLQHFRTNGEFDHLDLDYELSLEGCRSGKPVRREKNFKGCMESINYNGDNITDLAWKMLDTSSFFLQQSVDSQYLIWRSRATCPFPVETHTFPVFFNATSFLQLPGRASHNALSVGFQFRTREP
ncbi:contactin-associated protein-like 2 [Lates japonicus]|uniref:Contactin-associated protein-like 2 n=1 Tax=Lates japonicus TaxID=270547 RepID=A0AAD3MK06_LATJO|nr:contactin-associated protein-like 2 [Lates japonicus]